MLGLIKNNKFYILKSFVVLILSVVAIGCGGGGDKTTTPSSPSPTEQVLKGKAQKGAFLKGAGVTATKLNSLAANDSQTVSSTVSDNLGSFNIKTTWKGWTELNIIGRFYNEHSGENSATELSLISITEISSASKDVNVNLFTHFVATRTRTLVNSGATINQAWDTAQIELKKELQLLSNETNAEKLDLSNGEGDFKNDNAILLLFSGGFMANGGNATTMLALADDFANNGKFDGSSADFFDDIGNYAGENNNFDRLSNNLKENGIQNPPDESDLIVLPKWANQPPQANVSPAFKTIVVGQAITLLADLSFDPDGDQLSYSWTGNGTSACGNNPQCRLNGLSVDDHTITLSVIDEHGSRSKTVTSKINVINDNTGTGNEGNEIPVARLTVSASEVSEGATVGLDASRSSDEDGNDSDLVFNWFVSGANTDHCANKARCVLSNLSSGTYFITVQVKDLDGGSDSAANVVLVNPDNIAPFANAGADKTIFEGQNISLDASLSIDVDGNIATYAWTDGNTTPLGLEKYVTLANLSIGTHNIKLTVTDNEGATSSDFVNVHVKAVESTNQAPNANAGLNKTIIVGESITLDASASNDPDGNIVSYQWKKGGIVTGSSKTLILNALSEGTHTYTLTVTDNDGASDVDNITIVVTSQEQPINQDPVANAGTDKTIAVNTSITLDASASTDADGSIATYQWKKDTVVVGSAKTLVLDSLPEGVHTYTLTVTDDNGAKATDDILITVESVEDSIVINTPSSQRCTSLGLATYSFQGGVTGTGALTVQPYSESDCTGSEVGSPLVKNVSLTYSLANIVTVNSVITADMTIIALGQTRTSKVTIVDGIVTL